MKIVKIDTDGTKGLLGQGEFGLDNYPAGGDAGRAYYGDGTNNIALSKQDELDAVVAGTTGIDFDNTTSGLTATTVKTAIDEVDADLDAVIAGTQNVAYSNTVSGLTAVTVKGAVDELDSALDSAVEAVSDLDMVSGTSGTTKRFDKRLSALGVIDMEYTTGNLATVRYDGDDDASVYYRDVMTYTAGNLTQVDHFWDTADLVTASASTTLTYDVGGNLVAATYTE
jgi:hypothetical protein